MNRSREARRIAFVVALVALSLLAGAQAGTFDLGSDTTLDYKITLAYGVAIRTENPSNALLNGPVDPFQISVIPPAQPGQPFQFAGFTHTGLSTTINFDDGDRNFKRWSLVNNRGSALVELDLARKPYGFIASADAFYDQVYRHPNDNDSPLTTNVSGPVSEFTAATRYYDGQRLRLLEAYAYGDWNLGGDVNLNVRVGNHVVAYGESLFFPGISGAQSTADATKAFVPGAEIKEILLPTNQVSFQMSLTNQLSLLGYYKLVYKPNEIFPEGDYFAPSDAVGPGTTFVYGSANPASDVGNCPGLLQNLSIAGTNLPEIIPPALDTTVCAQILAPFAGADGAPAFIYTTRAGDIRPNKWGQYGGGVKYQIFPDFNIGLYYLRYDDPNPTVNLNYGFAPFTTTPVISTQIINQQVPTTYNVKYYGGIHLYGASFSTVLGPFNVGGDMIYRDGAGLPAQAYVSGVLSPIYTRGREGSVQASAIYAANPEFYFNDLAWVTEVGVHHVFSLDAIASSPGQIAVGGGSTPFYSSTAVGVQTLAIPTRHNIFEGWDMSTPLTFSALVSGTPELAGAFGALYGEGDMRLGASVVFSYLGNLQLGLGYNWFFGNVNKTIGNSTLKANPYADRDYATFTIKYDI